MLSPIFFSPFLDKLQIIFWPVSVFKFCPVFLLILLNIIFPIYLIIILMNSVDYPLRELAKKKEKKQTHNWDSQTIYSLHVHIYIILFHIILSNCSNIPHWCELIGIKHQTGAHLLPNSRSMLNAAILCNMTVMIQMRFKGFVSRARLPPLMSHALRCWRHVGPMRRCCACSY